jgi:hypothetical protein
MRLFRLISSFFNEKYTDGVDKNATRLATRSISFTMVSIVYFIIDQIEQINQKWYHSEGTDEKRRQEMMNDYFAREPILVHL